MRTSESISKIAPSMLKAQKEMSGAKKGSKNPFFKSSYADYNAVLEACKDALNDNGILILQPHIHEAERNYVETILMHESGEFISSETEIITAKKNDPQSLGSAITYARRYGLQSLNALPAEDDDGEKAMNRNPKKQTAKKQTNKAPATLSEYLIANKINPAKALKNLKCIENFGADQMTSIEQLNQQQQEYLNSNINFFVTNCGV